VANLKREQACSCATKNAAASPNCLGTGGNVFFLSFYTDSEVWNQS